MQHVRARSSSLGLLGLSPLFDSKALPPIPPPDLDGDDGDSDVDGDAGKGGEGTPRKNTRRRRGKRPKGKNAAAAAAGEAPIGIMKGVILFPDEVMDKDLGELILGEAEIRDDPEFDEFVPQADPQVIGGLAISETILGSLLVSLSENH